MAQCPHRRKEFECLNGYSSLTISRCSLCLQGQLADSIELNTSALMVMTADRMEAEIKSKQDDETAQAESDAARQAEEEENYQYEIDKACDEAEAQAEADSAAAEAEAMAQCEEEYYGN